MIRPAGPTDGGDIARLVVKWLAMVDVGDLLVSESRAKQTVQRVISDPSGLVLVHDDNGIDGCIVVASSDALCFERKTACIVFWYAETPGSGYAMLRSAVCWARGRPVIKALGFSADFGMDARVYTLFERAGLTQRGPVFARY